MSDVEQWGHDEQRAMEMEITRLRAENAELQNELTKGIHTCGPTCRKTPRCAEMADLRAELAVERKRVSSYRTLVSSLESQISRYRANASEAAEAIRTLDSDRQANATLTAELAQCQQEMQQIRQMGDTIPLPVCEAYGELWMAVTRNKRVHRARHLLLSCMTMEDRKTGIELVRERMRTSAARKGDGEA